MENRLIALSQMMFPAIADDNIVIIHPDLNHTDILSTFPNMAQIVTTREKVSSFALKMNKTINLTLSSRKKVPPMTLPMWRSDRDSLCYFFQPGEDIKPLSLKPKSNNLVISFRTFSNDRQRHDAVKK